MFPARAWVLLVAPFVPADVRDDWVEEWLAELKVSRTPMRHAWGALADAWYLRTEGWTVDSMWRDVRTAVRGLVRRPAFTLIGGFTLAVGIGANTAIFTVVDGVLINPLPFPEPEALVSYNYDAPGLGVNVPLIPHSEGMYFHYRDNARAIESSAVFSDDNVNLVTEGDPQRLAAMQVTSDYFTVVGIQPFLGRGFVEGEDLPGAEPVAVLSYALWEQSFGADRDVLGRVYEMDGVSRRIVGVMPERAAVTDEELWIPLTVDPAEADQGSLAFIGVARLAPGETVESADAEMEQLLLRYAEEFPDGLSAAILEQSGLTANVTPLKEVFVQDMRTALWVLLGTVGFVLLIACANVANLFLVRAEGRQRERAVRTAMGAGRLDIARQHLSEAMILSLGAGAVGLGLASGGVRALLALAPADLPQVLDIGIDGSVLLFTLAVAVVAGVLFGTFPAVGYGRSEISRSLRDGGRGSTDGRERHRMRSGLVVAQVALALVLLVGSGLMFRSFQALQSVDLGFESEGLLTFRYGLPRAEYSDPAGVLAFHRQLTDELAAVPGVTAVGMNTGLPLTGAKSATPMEPTDQPFPEGELGPLVERVQVSPGYFDAMSIDLLEGRALEWSDQADEYRGVVISRTLADAFWPGRSAVGQRIGSQGGEFDWEVVGVAADVRFDGVNEEPLPMAYYPLVMGSPEDLAPARGVDVVLRVGGDPLSAIPAARDALIRADGRLPMILPRTVDSVVSESLAATSFTVVLLGIAAAIALLLGTVGLYGVISYIVSRRTPEIGVRMALGAPAARVQREVVGEGMRLAVVGIAVGLGGAWATSRLLASLLYGVSATDPFTFGGTAVLLGTVALLATWIPARRASRVDPVAALKAE